MGFKLEKYKGSDNYYQKINKFQTAQIVKYEIQNYERMRKIILKYLCDIGERKGLLN